MNHAAKVLYSPGVTDEWYTPKWIIDRLGPFDLDPCSPKIRPFDTARIHLTQEDDGLMKGWKGRVWMNPPYSDFYSWVKRLAQHGNGISLHPARVETKAFHRYVFGKAHAVFFTLGRIKFLKGLTGTYGESPNFAPVFVAYGAENVEHLKHIGIKGKLIVLR